MNEKLAKHARKSESKGKREAMVELAKLEPGIARLPEDFDTDPYLLNVENGTLDLRSMKLNKHNREDLITKLAPVKYLPESDCPQWLRFLNQVFEENTRVISFLQRAIGWSLTGALKDQLFFILYGIGANGKSTFLNTITSMLGDYARNTPPETLLSGDRYSIPADVARLRGSRFVTSVETEEGKSMAESLIKQLTGEDMITARFLYANFFEFKPQFKLFLATNHMPEIKGNDYAIWRRIALIPFNVIIPPKEQDRQLSQKLLNELSGILNWATEGCMDWQQTGLKIPKEVRKATQEYRNDLDTIKHFIDECTTGQDSYKGTSAASIYGAYLDWCVDNGERGKSQREFGMKLTEKGYERKKKNSGIHYQGIALKR
ncbi:MAG: hypothetical protein HN416_11840 [Nitrospina sp.]|jgi:putative DNA primase/helicase|nr:hypothetical protein [Nitrospina sp.]